MLRNNVVLKTNASTGQTTGNIVNAVWERQDNPPPPLTTAQVASLPQEDVDSPHGRTIAKLPSNPTAVQSRNEKQTSVSNLFGSLSVNTSGWLIKMSSRYEKMGWGGVWEGIITSLGWRKVWFKHSKY